MLTRRGFLSRLFEGAVLGTALALGVRPGPEKVLTHEDLADILARSHDVWWSEALADELTGQADDPEYKTLMFNGVPWVKDRNDRTPRIYFTRYGVL